MVALSLTFDRFKTQRERSASLDCRTSSASGLGNQDHAEPGFALHHASVRIGSLFKRKGLNHWADVFKNAERKCIFVVNRRACKRSLNRAASKNERNRAQLDLIVRDPPQEQLAAS